GKVFLNYRADALSVVTALDVHAAQRSDSHLGAESILVPYYKHEATMSTSSRARIQRQLIAFLAVSGLGLSLSVAIRSQAYGRLSHKFTRVASAAVVAPEHSTWSDYAGAPDGAQYSALDQINRSNVSQLRVAWTYPTGDGS